MVKSHWKDYEYGAKIARENSIQLRNISNTLSRHKPSQGMALFCQYSAVEEMNKAILLLLCHRGFLNKGTTSMILSNHDVKSFLFQEIYHGKSRLEHNKIIIDDKELTWKNIANLRKKHKTRHKKNFDLRNKWLYVDQDEKLKKWTTPKNSIKNFNSQKSKLVIEFQALATFYDLVQTMEFDTMMDNFTINAELDKKGNLKGMSIMHDSI